MELSSIFTKDHQDSYYDNLLQHHKLVIKSVRNTNQKTVAEVLSMSEAKFSAIFKLLLAYADEKAN